MDEKEILKKFERDCHEIVMILAISDALPSEVQSKIIGTMLAVPDALIAIRDGREWRGRTDPKEIAREMLFQIFEDDI